jgi:hypothetical protein
MYCFRFSVSQKATGRTQLTYTAPRSARARQGSRQQRRCGGLPRTAGHREPHHGGAAMPGPEPHSAFSPATWQSNYNGSHLPKWAPDAEDSALGQLQRHMGSNSKWNTIREAFQRADTDGNGVIMRDELEIMCREMGLSSDVGAALLNQFDLDENGEWNYAEFCEVLKRQDYITYAENVPRDQFRRADPKRMPSPVPAIKPSPRQYDMLNGAPLSYVEADAQLLLGAPKQAAQFSPKSWRSEVADGYKAEWVKGGGSMEGSMIGSLAAGQSVSACRLVLKPSLSLAGPL